MTAKEIVESVLAALDIFIGWPVAILVVVLLFRKQIEQLFGVLSERLRRISVGGATAEFEDPELRELVRSMASRLRLDTPEDFIEEENLASASADEGDEVTPPENEELLERELDRLRRTLGR